MKRSLIAGLALCGALALAGCNSQTLAIVGQDLGVLAADLPFACANLSSALTTIATTPGVPSSAQTALTKGQSKYSKYCGPAAGVVADVATAVNDIQAVVVALQNLKHQ